MPRNVAATTFKRNVARPYQRLATNLTLRTWLPAYGNG